MDVQYILGQDMLTTELLDGLTPIDLYDPNYLGNFNSCYLGVVSAPLEFNGKSSVLRIMYFGSATSKEGEARRLAEHEVLLSLNHELVLLLRARTKALLFHELGTLPGAEHHFFAINRFPIIRNNITAGFQCRALAQACENLNVISAGKLD